MDDTPTLASLSNLQRKSLALLLAECAGAVLALHDRRLYERHRIRPKLDVVLERWWGALGGTRIDEREPSPARDASVAHLLPDGHLGARFEQMIAWSSPPEDERELLEWLEGSPDAIPNQVGLVAVCARDLLRRDDLDGDDGSYEDLFRNLRDLFGLTEAASAGDLVPAALELARGCDGSRGEQLRARARMRERADTALS